MNHELAKDSLTQNSIEPKFSPSPRKISLVILGVILLAGLGFSNIYAGAAKPEKAGKNGGREKQATPVTVAMVTQKTVPVQLQAIGNVQSGSTVAVTPQATGRIIGVYFKKGEEVKKGQLLFTLDDRTQNAAIQQAEGVLAKDQAQIEQARANLAKDQGLVEQAKAILAKDQGLVRQAEITLAKDTAQAKYAQAQSKRYNQLYQDGAISEAQAQQYSTNDQVSEATLQTDREAIANAQAVVNSDLVAIKNAEAVVKGDLAAIQNAEAVKRTDQAALDNVKVQSSYTKIYAPIDGRAGNILVNLGNVVQANSSNPLVTIVKIHPIQVAFSIPEANLSQVQKYMSNGTLKVDVNFSGSNKSVPGTLTFVNNTVDNSTGTIQLIGDFENDQGVLFPGQFVNTTLTLTQKPNATVVPAQAVQNGPKGQFVFVVKPDMTVENVPVTVSSTSDGLNVIEKGLKPEDKVVIDGQANLVSGSKITTKTTSDANSGNEQINNSPKPKSNRSNQKTGGDS
jgi:multidrug efflux system membrane fusion protein